MKCPKCLTVSTKKERPAGACPKCGWVFRFDPPAPLSDFEVEHALHSVSQGGALRFTRAQLVAEVERVLVRRLAGVYEAEATAVLANTDSYVAFWAAGGLIAAGLFLILVLEEPCGTPLILLSVLLAISRLVRRPPLDVATELRARRANHDPRAAAIVDKYVAGSASPLLLSPPQSSAQVAASPRAFAREFDLESYGFDRVIVVQGDENVDMLVKNHFHFQHNAAIVSFTGYPSHVAELVQNQIEGGSVKAKVFLLHDASAEGYRLRSVWKESAWGKPDEVFDVGLTRANAERLLPRQRASGETTDAVPEADRAFFATESVALAALRPQQMMTLLFNAMTAADRGAGSVELADDYDTVASTSYDFG